MAYMNKDLLQTQWADIRETLRDTFSNLTDEDIRQINGRYDKLVTKLQERYGYTREEAEERLGDLNFDRFATSRSRVVRGETPRREADNSSLLKWLAVGIPLLLLGVYFLSDRTHEPTRAPAYTQEQVIQETPADRTISTGIRNSLLAERGLTTDLQNVRISTNNGVVTLSGFVSNRETRDMIVNRVENFSGVREVINNIAIR
jgi:uncharacterized protein YjbJ (UPF0337 family)